MADGSISMTNSLRKGLPHMASEITQRQRAEAALNINDRVRVSGTRYVRVIESFLPDVDGGVKLNKPVNGFGLR